MDVTIYLDPLLAFHFIIGGNMRILLIVAFFCLMQACAHSPKVIRSFELKEQSNVTCYSLPRADVTVAGTLLQKTFYPGPYTAALEAWLKSKDNGASSCRGHEMLDPLHKCYWGFRSNRPPTADALAFCDLATGTESTGLNQRYLYRSEPLIAKTSASPDPHAHFAIDMNPSLFEKLETGITVDVSGVITDFKATSTNLAAETAQALISRAVDVAAFPMEDGGHVNRIDEIQFLVNHLAEAERERLRFFDFPNPAAAVAAIDAKIARLRQLAEGRVDEKPFIVSLDLNPDIARDVVNKQQSNSTEPKNLLGCAAPTCENGGDCGSCGICPAISFRTVVTADVDSVRTSETAKSYGLESGSLRYRVPVRASTAVDLRCWNLAIFTDVEKKTAVAPCTASISGPDTKPIIIGVSIPVQGPVVIPQWGPTLALPRDLGWRSGSISARLDANTGALLTISAKNDDAVAAGLVNDAYKAALAREKAGGVDEERLAIERESAILQNRVKICLARSELGLPPGPECPLPLP